MTDTLVATPDPEDSDFSRWLDELGIDSDLKKALIDLDNDLFDDDDSR